MDRRLSMCAPLCSRAQILRSARIRRLRQLPQFAAAARDKRPRLVCPARHAAITREYDGLGTGAHAKLVEDAGEVIAHSLFADEELCRDVVVAVAARDQIKDLALARGEHGEIVAGNRSIGGAAARCLSLPAEKFADYFLPSLPCRLTLDEDVVVGLELDELCVGDARRNDAALIERHHHVTARMQDQRGRLYEFHAFTNIN